MPRPPSDEPLRKITLNVYDADVDELQAIYGSGYTGVIRDIIRTHIRRIRGPEYPGARP